MAAINWGLACGRDTMALGGSHCEDSLRYEMADPALQPNLDAPRACEHHKVVNVDEADVTRPAIEDDDLVLARGVH
jgi:hypothetical protein